MASPTIVQHKSAFGNAVASGGSVSATFTSNVTAGNMIVAFVGVTNNVSSNAVTVNTPTMTGETFTAWTGAASAGSGPFGQTRPFAVNSAAGGQKIVSCTVTFAGGGSVDVHLHIVEVNGQSGSPRDAQGNTESATMSVSTSGATTTANDLVLAFFYDNPNNVTFTQGSGYSSVEQTNNSTGGDAAFTESKSVSATGVQTATASGNGTDTVNQSIVAIAGASSFAPDELFFAPLLQIKVDPIISIWG